jgi:hypothetical protein
MVVVLRSDSLGHFDPQESLGRTRSIRHLGGDMLKVNNELKGLDIEFNLDAQEKATLSAYVKQQGFDIIQRIMEDCVRKFNFNLLNTDPANQDKVLANHYLAKVSAMFYTSLMERIETECQIDAYNNRNKELVEEAVTASTPEWK